MKEEKKIKNTKLGAWLKSKAPNVFTIMGDVLPDKGALGIVKNLLDNEPDADPAEANAMIDAEVKLQENVTDRRKGDMGREGRL